MDTMQITSYKDLTVWQKSMELVIAVYDLTALFPKTEMYGLSAQMRKSSSSIPSNIAEGSRRSTRKDYRNFILIAFGSGAELETQVELVKRLPFGVHFDCQKVDSLLSEVMKMLNAFAVSLEK